MSTLALDDHAGFCAGNRVGKQLRFLAGIRGTLATHE